MLRRRPGQTGRVFALMWYFAWILGVLLACAFGIINVMWLEVDEQFRREDEAEGSGKQEPP